MQRRVLWAAAVAGFLVAATLLVYLGGGTKTPLPHAFYLAVVSAAVVFGLRAGVVTAVLAGLLCGPFMPLDVEAGTLQEPSGWLTRLGFFIAVAVVAGVGRNRMLELADARQRFLSAVSHELRTPLSAVLGFSHLVVTHYDELTDEECREFAALMHQEAMELSNVIDHYVLEGRLAHPDKVVVDVSDVDLEQVVEVVLTSLPEQVRKRMQVETDAVVARADPLRVRQIVRALINNALAYGGETILVRVQHDGGSALVKVGDVRGGRSRFRFPQPLPETPSHPPLGVGLAVARRMAVLMRGELTYRLNGEISYELRLPSAQRERRRSGREHPAVAT